MRLLKVRFRDFRRFRGTCSLDLDETLIALVGPNEAGKSSALDGIEMLLQRRAPEDRDIARGSGGQAEIGGLFLLERDDRAAISEIYDGERVERAWVVRRTDSAATMWTLEPSPRRDLRPRRRCEALVRALEEDPSLDPQYSENPELPWDPQLYSDALDQLSSDTETLNDEAIQSLETLAARLREIRHPAPTSEGDNEQEEINQEAATTDEQRSEARSSAASALDDLARIERLPTPWRQVVEVLDDRLPSVAFFRAEDRALQSTYMLSEIADNPPSALENLCRVAKLSLSELSTSWETNRPYVEKLIEDANDIAKSRFQLTWNQSSVYPRLIAPHDGILRLFISTEGEAGYSEIQERSDGLRWFVALDAFLAAQGTQQPVLLVDEAETHLHYDAQADLIDALMRQQLAAKVIYTTHSVGCLPPDLGRGIRAVLPRREDERSTIANSYWSITPDGDAKIGYTPLLFAMGARLLSLTVPRYALICEGPSEAILLPTLMREIAEVSQLTYRIVPGLSEIAKTQVQALAHHAGKLACLTDGDKGGKRLMRQIATANVIDKSGLFNLSTVAAGCTLEDLVDADVFAHAVNIELETWGITGSRLTSTDIPQTGRSNALKIWCEAQGGNPESLNKNRIAQRIVDLRLSGDDGSEKRHLVATHVAQKLKDIHVGISKALGIHGQE